jgi:hypothetical protein
LINIIAVVLSSSGPGTSRIWTESTKIARPVELEEMRARQAKGLNRAALLWTTLSNFQMPHRHLRDKAIGKEF